MYTEHGVKKEVFWWRGTEGERKRNGERDQVLAINRARRTR